MPIILSFKLLLFSHQNENNHKMYEHENYMTFNKSYGVISPGKVIIGHEKIRGRIS